MKLLFVIALPFLLISCELSSTKQEDPLLQKKEKPPEPEPPVEEPVEEPDDALDFVDPITTGKLLTDEDKKTVAGPVPVKVPDPAEDTAIDVEPSIPSEE